MNFNSYIVSETKTAYSVPLTEFLVPKKTKAFTLAETLITLSIIGVVAAITVPTLITNFQKASYVAGLKKAYSQLNNAWRMIPITAGCSAGDYVCAGIMSSDWASYDNAGNQTAYISMTDNNTEILSRQFKVKKYCSSSDQSEECNLKALLKSPMAGKNTIAGFKTEDGLTFGIHNNFLVVDVNGIKGPNRGGRDQFAMAYESYENIIVHIPSESDHMGCEELVKKGDDYYASQFCTHKILQEGKMDY